MTKQTKPPNGWGVDALTTHLQMAHENRFATFANKKVESQLLIALDGCFVKIVPALINPNHPVAAMLLIRTHALFRGACEHAMAGQLPETFNIIRACLECAGYSLHIAKNPGADRVFLQRHDDAAALQTSKNMFKVSEVRKTITAANAKAGEVFDLLYQLAIDQGGHPNEQAITGNMRMIEGDGKIEIQQVYLHGDGLQLDFALKSTARAGVCTLEILREVFPERFRLLGITDEVLKLRRGL